jgi:hypothetical protein
MNRLDMDRRTFLRGAGGAVMALPILEATAGDAAGEPPMRLAAGGIFYGFVPERFHPKETGADYAMPQLLKPLERHRRDFTVFSGLDHNIGGGHEATKYFLSGIPLEHSKAYEEANVSIDQKVAAFVGGATRFPSLAFGCEVGNENFLSWTRNGSQVRPFSNLDAMYHLLFRESGKKAKKTKAVAMAERESILDLVRDQAKRFEKGLGGSDRTRKSWINTLLRCVSWSARSSSRVCGWIAISQTLTTSFRVVPAR